MVEVSVSRDPKPRFDERPISEFHARTRSYVLKRPVVLGIVTGPHEWGAAAPFEGISENRSASRLGWVIINYVQQG